MIFYRIHPLQLNVGRVLMKDEGARMGLKAFKALGVGFSLSEEIRRRAQIENILVANHPVNNL